MSHAHAICVHCGSPDCACYDTDAEYLEAIAEQKRQQKERRQMVTQEELDDEQKRRIYYQDIVYAVCNSLDRIFGKRPGKGIVCGRMESPTTQVQDHMREIESRCAQWAKVKAALQPGDSPAEPQ